MNDLVHPKVDRTAFSVSDASAPSDEAKFWSAKTPHERIEAVELLRQIVYGYDPATERLQRVLEVVERKPR